jgi:O-antigen ligase
MLLLETGILGIFLYAIFYLLSFCHAGKIKKNKPDLGEYCVMVQIVDIFCFIWMMYNQSLRSECAYYVFFVLSIPIIIGRERKQFAGIKMG